MAGTSTSQKMQEVLKEAEQLTAKNKKSTSTESRQEVAVDEKFADIEGNTFFKIIFSDATPEEKKDAVAQSLTFSQEQTKEENVTRLKEFELFKEYLQSERKRMAQEIIKLTDTDAFSELKDVYEQMNNAVLEFDNSMAPLMEIIDAVYQLRMKGSDVTKGVFKEIQDDKIAEIEREQKLKENADKLQALQDKIAASNKDIAVLGEDKSFFGFGSVKKSARESIAMKQLELQQASAEVTSVMSEIETLKNTTSRESEFSELSKEKAKLRELLDISSPEHKERSKRLVKAAQDFINTSETRVGSVLGHFGKMEGQIETLFDANNGMQNIYAIVSEATTDASKENKKNRDLLVDPKENETKIQQMQRENKKMAIEDYITNMDSSTVDTAKTFADLTTQSYRIKGMKDANREQVTKTRQLHSSGVAGVADRLSTVLQVVSNAALNESSEMAANTLNSMNDSTNVMSLKESLRIAAGIKDVGNSLEKAIDDLKAYRDTAKTVTASTIENLEYVKRNQEIMVGIIGETRAAVKEQMGANAEVNLNGGETPVATPAAANDSKPKPQVKKQEGSPLSRFGKLSGGM